MLLHPFPAHGSFWDPIASQLEQRYDLIIPDLRAHGSSGAGEGPATMALHAEDLRKICDQAGVARAAFIGCSIGGYILFEFLRQHGARVSAVALCNTKAAPDSDEGRANRMAAVTQIEKQGPAEYLDSLAQKLVGDSSQRNRPDILRAARGLMDRSTVAGLRASLLGMAARPDSVPSLAAISAPTLILGGEEDTTISPADLETMQRGIRKSRMEVIPGAGHYTPLEKPEIVGRHLRQFLDANIQ
jgi:pimeloyl-ACP methyl ester carboxylesterase